MINIFQYISFKTVVIIVVSLLFGSTMFISENVFIESKTISQWYAFVTGTNICIYIVALSLRRQSIQFNMISLMVLIFIGYLLIQGVLYEVPNTKLLLFVSFLLCFLFFKIKNIPYTSINTLIVVICVSQACNGLLQYIGCFTNYSAFRILGSFDNPAGFAASLAIGYPFCFAWIDNPQSKLKFIGIIFAIVIAIAIILSDSRTGIITILISSVTYLYVRYKHILRYKRFLFVILPILLLILVILLFLYKKDSSIGRLLIWKNSVVMILDKPLTGHGTGSFLSKYMLYQADYFKNHPNSEFSQLADNVSHPFNEYLLVAIEQGLLGLFVIILGILLIIPINKVDYHKLALLSLIVFACFSYPIKYGFAAAVLAYSLSQIHIGKSVTINFSIRTKSVLLIISILLSFFLFREISFKYRWEKLVQMSKIYKYEHLINDYNLIHEAWNKDAFFLYNYSVILNRTGKYDHSLTLLNECQKHLNDYDVQMLLADNYMNIHQFEKAKYHYTKASFMCPNRFMPLYKIFKIYEIEGKSDSAQAIALIISQKQVKVPSNTVSYIKQETKKNRKQKHIYD